MDNEATKATLKRRQIHDPRLYRALLAKLNNSKTSLLDALTIGGCSFPTIGTIAENRSTYSVPDLDGVPLGRRKNQLVRLVREAKILIELNKKRNKTTGSTSVVAHGVENTDQSSIFVYSSLRSKKKQHIEPVNVDKIILTFPRLEENPEAVYQSPSSACVTDSNLFDTKTDNTNTQSILNVACDGNVDANVPKSKKTINTLGSSHNHVTSHVKNTGQSSFEPNVSCANSTHSGIEKLESPNCSSNFTHASKKRKRRIGRSHIVSFSEVYLDDSEGVTDGESVDTYDILSGYY